MAGNISLGTGTLTIIETGDGDGDGDADCSNSVEKSSVVEQDKHTANDVNVANDNDDDNDDTNNPTATPPQLTPLSKSNRLKKYITLTIISSLAFVSAYESDLQHVMTSYSSINDNDYEPGSAAYFVNGFEVVPASTRGRNYAMVLSGTSAVYHFIIVLIHLLDAVLCDSTQRLRKMFQDGSELELVLIVLSTVWWLIGTWILTSIHGVAGDGRGQFNLYFSTWLCLISNVSMVEMWLIAAGHASVYQAVSSWPNRAPGWIKIFIVTLASLLSICDIFFHYENVEVLPERLQIKYAEVPTAEWVCLFLACAMSLVTAFGFSLIELFRREEYHVRNIKSSGEMSLEGICLASLVFVWVPIVVIATTDGACSEVGNSYFLTWASCAVVIQTFINWLQDWRKGVQSILLEQDREYQESMQASRVAPIPSTYEDDDDSEDEEIEVTQPGRM